MASKNFVPIDIKYDKKELENEKIIFIDYTLSNNSLIFLSSNNNIYLCHITEDSLEIIKKLVNIINNTKIRINKCYFCNEDKNYLLLFCDDYNILEYSIERDYISHIYYNSLGDFFIFKMNCQKNSNPENGIRNFCVFKDGELNVWNTLKYNKSNVLYIQDINCFSYDTTGILLYIVGKNNSKKIYFLSAIKFISEYECKEIYYKLLDFIDFKLDINYIDTFDDNIIMFDRISCNIYILKNYPINKFDFIIPLNYKNRDLPLILPFVEENLSHEFGLLFINFKEEKKKLININYKSKHIRNVDINLIIKKTFYFKENTKGKGLLFVFNDLTKELKKYLL